MHIVIIGGDATAVKAALCLRRQNNQISITILEKSAELSAATCALPLFLQGDVAKTDDLQIASPQLLHNVFNIKVKLSCTISKIDTFNKIIYLTDSHTLKYDKLIFAFPPLHWRPDIKGIYGDNIFTLHNTSSAQLINDYFWGLNARKIIILGGDYQGVQIAQSFAKLNAEVTIIEHKPHILNLLDYEFAHLAENILQKHHIRLLTSTEITAFLPHHAITSAGQKIDYDMAIIATGSHYDILLPVISGLQLGATGGIIVDENMQTNICDIYACGEIIELKNTITQTPFRIRNANLSARTAHIAALACLKQNHKPLSIFNNQIIKIYDDYAAVCGCTESELKAANIAYQKIYFSGDINENYISFSQNLKVKLLFDCQGQILGAQLWGQSGIFARVNIIAALIAQKAKVQDLAQFYFSYTPELTRTKDALNIVGSLAQEVINCHLKTIGWTDLQQGHIILNVGAPKSLAAPQGVELLDIPFSKLRNFVSELPRNQIIATYCLNGYSAYLAYCLLTNIGFENVFLLNSPINWQ